MTDFVGLPFPESACYRIHEIHAKSSQWQQATGNKINLKTDDGWEANFLPGTDNTL